MESTAQNNNIKAKKEVRELFNEVRELFNEIRSNIIREDRKEIRKKLHKKETIRDFFDGSYILYESRGDKDAKLAID